MSNLENRHFFSLAESVLADPQMMLKPCHWYQLCWSQLISEYHHALQSFFFHSLVNKWMTTDFCMKMQPFGMAAFIVKADLILDESNLNCTYRLNKKIYILYWTQGIFAFLFTRTAERKKDWTSFIFRILLKYNLGKKKTNKTTQELYYFNTPS